jgi:3',5'-cyclic AMP phosphodiesterase CpdA
LSPRDSLLRLAAVAGLFCAGATGRVSRGPYLQSLTDSSVVVCWQTSTPQAGQVQYGLTSAYGRAVSHVVLSYNHELTLTGLARETAYHYRVVSGADTTDDNLFRTPVGPAARFRFVVYGDNRTDSAAHHSVVAQVVRRIPGPAFLLSVGDLTENGTATDYQAFFDIEASLLSRMPLYPAVGNHDARNMGNWFSAFALPGDERWYSFRHGNSAFVVLDNESGFSPGTAQYRWLVSELRADSADPAIRHVFVVLHEPAYTTSLSHLSNLGVRQHLGAVFEWFGVDVVFSGHIHAYEHSLVKGVHYVTTGGGGAPLATSWGAAQPWTVYREGTYQFCVVDVHGDTVAVRGVRPDGTEFDRFEFLTRPDAAR